MKKSVATAGILIVLLFTSCAVNRKLSYDSIRTEITANANATYAIATHDQRNVILDGSRDEKFVGYLRSSVAIAYPIGTKSEQNFSDDFSNVIKNSLKGSSQAQIIKTSSSDSKQEVLKKLIDSQSKRLLLLTVSKWRTDSKPNGMLYGTEVIWDLSLAIYNNKGELMASNRTEGIDPDLDRGLAASVKKIQALVNEKFKEKVDLLFNDPKIKEVMNAEVI